MPVFDPISEFIKFTFSGIGERERERESNTLTL